MTKNGNIAECGAQASPFAFVFQPVVKPNVVAWAKGSRIGSTNAHNWVDVRARDHNLHHSDNGHVPLSLSFLFLRRMRTRARRAIRDPTTASSSPQKFHLSLPPPASRHRRGSMQRNGNTFCGRLIAASIWELAQEYYDLLCTDAFIVPKCQRLNLVKELYYIVAL